VFVFVCFFVKIGLVFFCLLQGVLDLMDERDQWKMLETDAENMAAVTTIAEAVCTHRPTDIKPIVEFLEPVLKRVYDAQRTGAAAVMAEFINQRCVCFVFFLCFSLMTSSIC
jgi:hypothetical protein